MKIEGGNEIWVNGEFVAWGDARVHVMAHALHYGSSVFEGIRAYASSRGTAVLGLEPRIEGREALQHLAPGPNRPLCIVLVGLGVAEVGEQAVAQILDDVPIVALDRLRAPSLEGLHDLAVHLGIDPP